MKNEKLLRQYLTRKRARSLKRIFHLLACGKDVEIETLYAAIVADGDKRPYRYKQQHVGHFVWMLNRRLFPRFNVNVVIKPGIEPRTYRIYAKEPLRG